MNVSDEIASALLEIKAVKINPNEPFTWASGWKSPIYCDNRKTLSYPEVRKAIYTGFAEIIKIEYPETETIAGVATGAVAHGALVAEALNLPFVYVRSAPKGHGLKNLVEGELKNKAKVVIIEDLISTGGSSIAAVEALREAGAETLALLAIFSYGFDAAAANFNKANCKFRTLTDYHALLNEALKRNYIKDSQLNMLKKWREAPDKFGV
ncbi:MAG: orotate phosphoribosyltransferase [Prevotellaceae bacterium]|jgi:orotate phosphoribosyltransferase|nr:orotate phosphoribosyltransferase [Prevotellaceae bacterium]